MQLIINLFATKCFPRSRQNVHSIAQQSRTQTRIFDVFGIIDSKMIHFIRKISISRASGGHVKVIFAGSKEGLEICSVQVFWVFTHLLRFVVDSDFEISAVIIFITFTNKEILIIIGRVDRSVL